MSSLKVEGKSGIIQIGSYSVSKLNFDRFIRMEGKDEASREAGVELSVIPKPLKLLLTFLLTNSSKMKGQELLEPLGSES